MSAFHVQVVLPESLYSSIIVQKDALRFSLKELSCTLEGGPYQDRRLKKQWGKPGVRTRFAIPRNSKPGLLSGIAILGDEDANQQYGFLRLLNEH